jgi:hypothetical protein
VQHVSFYNSYSRVVAALKPFGLVIFESLTGVIYRHFTETGVAVPGSITVNSLQMDSGDDRCHFAMQTGDFRWQYAKIGLEDLPSAGKIVPRSLF